MFGDFTLTYNNRQIELSQSRKNKVFYLLQYLLYHMHQGIPRETLIERLYADEGVDNPQNALRIAVTRLRKHLAKYLPPGVQAIWYKGGQYGFTDKIPCEIDCLLFDGLWAQASKKDLPDEERLELSLSALDLYRGDFLPKLSGDDWASSLCAQYAKKYFFLLFEAAALLKSAGRTEELLSICDRALRIYPLEEEIHVLKIEALIDLQRFCEALDAHNAATALLFDELGVEPSEKLLSLYHALSERVSGAAAPLLSILRGILRERDAKAGAYYCNFPAFIDSYRFTARAMERSGQSVFLMLCSLTNSKGEILKPGRQLSRAAACLHRVIRGALRRGDLYTRYNPSQYIALLPGISRENCKIVSGRIGEVFRETFGGRGVQLSYQILTAADLKTPKTAAEPDPPAW